MRAWSHFSPEEIERRRQASVAAMTEFKRAEFEHWHQAWRDRLYWSIGQCCAGCDHWISDGGGKSGQCSAAGIVSGGQVLKSMGITSASFLPSPGFPYSEASFHCGKFKDDFDWSTLDWEYLSSIGAVRHGALRNKPTTTRTGGSHG
ncbi:hypothetical protein [Mesorhizobium sp. CAU 1741]|uniref:hypothetical protein n=1 Tax=Mesorhizobium sp. CAU 1741 TaxID=3140366 RepID=UPI00325A8C30